MPISAYLKALRQSIGTELVLMPGVAALIRDDEGRLLLIRRSDNGRLSFPAGVIDPGETAARAVRREVFEETGLDVEPVALAGVLGPRRSVYENGDQVEYTVAVFRCRVRGGTLCAVDGEAAGFAWMHPEELGELLYPAALLTWETGDPPYFSPPAS
jgi:8-oxo-dGTP pyrophosphatase MutT (NUDIX family)